MTEWNEWIEAEKQELSKVMGRYGVQWKQLGTHNKHLWVLDFEKQERQKEVAELEQTISGSKEELSSILHQQVAAGQEVNKMVQSKEVMERNIHAYDEDVKWQLAEPGALMSAKAYQDKKALPLVEIERSLER